jgi:hypothetical protein
MRVLDAPSRLPICMYVHLAHLAHYLSWHCCAFVCMYCLFSSYLLQGALTSFSFSLGSSCDLSLVCMYRYVLVQDT